MTSSSCLPSKCGNTALLLAAAWATLPEAWPRAPGSAGTGAPALHFGTAARWTTPLFVPSSSQAPSGDSAQQVTSCSSSGSRIGRVRRVSALLALSATELLHQPQSFQ